MDVNKVRQIGRTTVKDSGFYLKNDVYNRIKQLRLVLQTNFNAKILSPPAISQMRKRIPSDVTSKLVIVLLVFLTLPSTFFSFSMSASSSLVKKKAPMISFLSVLHFISSLFLNSLNTKSTTSVSQWLFPSFSHLSIRLTSLLHTSLIIFCIS